MTSCWRQLWRISARWRHCRCCRRSSSSARVWRRQRCQLHLLSRFLLAASVPRVSRPASHNNCASLLAIFTTKYNKQINRPEETEIISTARHSKHIRPRNLNIVVCRPSWSKSNDAWRSYGRKTISAFSRLRTLTYQGQNVAGDRGPLPNISVFTWSKWDNFGGWTTDGQTDMLTSPQQGHVRNKSTNQPTNK